MKIRRYANKDCNTVSRLFYETVHAVNAKDYPPRQLFVWADSADSLQERRSSDLTSQYTLIAELGGIIVGFGSIDKSGYLDLLFVHKDYQRREIATFLCDELEKDFDVVKTCASITAKPFFEMRGYTVVKEQEVERSGVKLKNFEMKKMLFKNS